MGHLDFPHNTSKPGKAVPHRYSPGEDSAKYVLTPNVQFERPWLAVPGGSAFIWPVGTEGFRYFGSADLAIHKYLGDDEIELSVTHMDEPRVELSGTFPGNTSANNLRALKAIVVAKTPERGKILHIPFIFPRMQYVVVESYDFSHEQEDMTDSIRYNISFLKIGVGRKISLGTKAEPSVNPTKNPGKTKGKSSRIFVVKAGKRTLKLVSKSVYGSPSKWSTLFNKNEKALKKIGFTKQNAATKLLPIGFKVSF